jgi:PadR family transcriptional regulator, regulatory protein AphA
MSNPRMTETSFIVLGLLELAEEATPYTLKQIAQRSVFNFWSVPHTQIYTECERLAKAGLLDERREEGGRRRRIYTLTKLGRKTLEAWRNEPTSQIYEVRDPGVLKLFFGGDPAKIAHSQSEMHQRKLEEFERAEAEIEGGPLGPRLALELGITHQREFTRIWSELAESVSDDT